MREKKNLVAHAGSTEPRWHGTKVHVLSDVDELNTTEKFWNVQHDTNENVRSTFIVQINGVRQKKQKAVC